MHTVGETGTKMRFTSSWLVTMGKHYHVPIGAAVQHSLMVIQAVHLVHWPAIGVLSRRLDSIDIYTYILLLCRFFKGSTGMIFPLPYSPRPYLVRDIGLLTLTLTLSIFYLLLQPYRLFSCHLRPTSSSSELLKSS